MAMDAAKERLEHDMNNIAQNNRFSELKTAVIVYMNKIEAHRMKVEAHIPITEKTMKAKERGEKSIKSYRRIYLDNGKLEVKDVKEDPFRPGTDLIE